MSVRLLCSQTFHKAVFTKTRSTENNIFSLVFTAPSAKKTQPFLVSCCYALIFFNVVDSKAWGKDLRFIFFILAVTLNAPLCQAEEIWESLRFWQFFFLCLWEDTLYPQILALWIHRICHLQDLWSLLASLRLLSHHTHGRASARQSGLCTY